MYTVSKLRAFTYKENVRSIGALDSAGFVKIEEYGEDGKLSGYLAGELY